MDSPLQSSVSSPRSAPSRGESAPGTGYSSLSEYGLIGDLDTCALVDRHGSIDWYPVPYLKSPSVFAGLLDAEEGGCFSVRPAAAYESSQAYLDGTNVLRTTFRTATGELSVTDFMPVQRPESGVPQPAVYRKVVCESGTVDVDLTFRPRFDYARRPTTVEAHEGGLLAESGDEIAFLSTDLSFDVGRGEATTTVTLEAGETTWLAFTYGDATPVCPRMGPAALDETVAYWREWADACDKSGDGAWHDLVVRSGLVLKLLTQRETGAVAAAPTTSLPESVGGVRNWDYRYNWIRDAAFTLQTLSNLGHGAEADAYFDWFLDRCRAIDPEGIRPLCGLHGGTDLAEASLDHLSGYRDSAPVRIGNGAADQRQLDVYGELVLAVYEASQHGDWLTPADWEAIRDIVDHVCEVWTEPDASIWEVRDGPHHFVFSKVMCWVALDRGIALAEEGGFDAPLDRWRDVRAEIKRVTIERGYDRDRGTFIQAFGRPDTLDAAALLIPVVGFLPADDERVQGTIESVRDRLATDDGLVHRYDGPDGLPGEEGSFLFCSFWLVDALAMSGRVAEARDLFAQVLDYASPLGLLAEEVDPNEGALLGNFPQAFSHVGLVNSALYLERCSGRDDPDFAPMGLTPPDALTRTRE